MTGYGQNENSVARSVSPSRDGVVMPMRIAPKDGDLVVRQETRHGMLVYDLHTAPGPEQYLLHSREEAVAQAVTRAKRRHVRVWLTSDEGYDYVLLEDFRRWWNRSDLTWWR
jgi:hypothetical protein